MAALKATLDPIAALKAKHDHYDAIYRNYADVLRRYVRRLTSDRGLSESLVDTEGVVQEAFFAMGRFGGTIHDPRAWLFTVARREVSKAAEKHQHRRADGDPDTLLDTDTARWSSLTPQASAEDRYDLRRALEALTELSDRQKQTLYMHRVEGWKYREIAEALGIEENTVGPHINRANTRLREWAASNGFKTTIKIIIGIIASAIAAILGGSGDGVQAAMAPSSPEPEEGQQRRRAPRKIRIAIWLVISILVLVLVVHALSAPGTAIDRALPWLDDVPWFVRGLVHLGAMLALVAVITVPVAAVALVSRLWKTLQARTSREPDTEAAPRNSEPTDDPEPAHPRRGQPPRRQTLARSRGSKKRHRRKHQRRHRR